LILNNSSNASKTGKTAASQKRRVREREQGQSLVELAIAIPVLMLLLMGVIEFGHGMNSYLTVLAASRDAARLEAQDEWSEDVLLNLIAKETTKLPSGAITGAENCANKNTGVCITGINSDGSAQPAGCGSPQALVGGKECVRVRVCYDHPLIAGIPFYPLGPLNMCAQTTMRLAHE
jgi:hypothetical protein